MVQMLEIGRTFFDPGPGLDTRHADPWAFYQRIEQLTRGGLPCRSFSEGPASAGAKLPLPDRYDQELTDRARRYQLAARAVVNAIQVMQREQAAVLNVIDALEASRLAEAERGPEASTCRSCQAVITGVGNDRARVGQCQACYRQTLRAGQTVDTNTCSVVT